MIHPFGLSYYNAPGRRAPGSGLARVWSSPTGEMPWMVGSSTTLADLGRREGEICGFGPNARPRAGEKWPRLASLLAEIDSCWRTRNSRASDADWVVVSRRARLSLARDQAHGWPVDADGRDPNVWVSRRVGVGRESFSETSENPVCP